MALITGSSAIDWSTTSVTLDVEQQLDRVVQVFNEPFQILSATPTQIRVRFLTSGGTAIISGSGFGTASPVITSFNYSNPATGDILRFTGTFNGVGNEIFNSMTIGFPGFRATIIGNLVLDPLGNLSGSITQLRATLGSTQLTIKGSLVLAGNDISGTVTQISVLSGTNTITMSGLSLPFNALDSVTTVNDLFSVVGNQLASNDTITYTNNSGAGMTFYSGGGNDTISISGSNADTLNGGTGNDILAGGLGQDTVNGDVGDDQITMLVTTGNEDTIDAGADTDTLVLNGIVPGDQVVVVDLASLTDQVVSIGGVAEALTQTNFENLNASGIGSSVTVTGSDGDNRIIGSKGDDFIDGGAGNDAMRGGKGNDTYTVDSVGDVVSETLNAGTDTVFSSMTYTLGLNVENLTLTGTDHLNGTGNTLANVLTGNDGNNVLTSGAGKDTLIGGDGNDTLLGGGGRDTVQGNAGDDVVQLISPAQFAAGEVIDGGANTDTLRYTGNLATTLTLTNLVTNIEQVQIANATGDASGIAAINVNAAAVANGLSIIGNNGANVLTSTSQADTLTGNGGNDRLRGGLGNDTYQVNRGDGRDRISENDSTLGNSDTLLYGPTINPLDLVLSRQVNDLRLAIHGGTDQVTIQNWYANPTAAQVETIQAGNGDVLLNTRVDQLIQAMAQFTTDTGLSWGAAIAGGGTPEQQAQFQGILAANWQSP